MAVKLRCSRQNLRRQKTGRLNQFPPTQTAELITTATITHCVWMRRLYARWSLSLCLGSARVSQEETADGQETHPRWQLMDSLCFSSTQPCFSSLLHFNTLFIFHTCSDSKLTSDPSFQDRSSLCCFQSDAFAVFECFYSSVTPSALCKPSSWQSTLSLPPSHFSLSVKVCFSCDLQHIPPALFFCDLM